ncbi:MAG: C-GCAxxG-C-C family protein [Gammaproteobacteria bacterium]|nr:C-GCAxxG-C-C family protein [Gammaproteobacteria bacterium]MDH5652476.1 C-GCAxxG-C-C family protein [Gammaproteobacteria bacterium]
MTCCDNDLYCAETVLKTVADNHQIQSPLIPRIATGLCSGMARSNGPCGAMTGGILALNLFYGRDTPAQGVERSYAAVQELIERFQEAHGNLHCHDLLGCDLNTAEGQQCYRDQQLNRRCASFADKTIELVEAIIKTA